MFFGVLGLLAWLVIAFIIFDRRSWASPPPPGTANAIVSVSRQPRNPLPGIGWLVLFGLLIGLWVTVGNPADLAPLGLRVATLVAGAVVATLAAHSWARLRHVVVVDERGISSVEPLSWSMPWPQIASAGLKGGTLWVRPISVQQQGLTGLVRALGNTAVVHRSDRPAVRTVLDRMAGRGIQDAPRHDELGE